MSLGVELRVYLSSLKCLGLLCITHEPLDSEYRTHASRTDETLALAGLVSSQCIALLALGHAIVQPRVYELPIYSTVGNVYYLANYGLSCLMVSLFYVYFYLRRRSFLLLVSLLLYHNRVDLGNCHSRQFLRLYILFVSQVLLTGLLQMMTMLYSDIAPWYSFLLFFFVTISYVLIALVIAFYNCLVQIVASLVRLYNRDLTTAVHSRAPLSTTLCRLRLLQRNRLLWVCQQRLSSDFGLVLMIIIAFLLFSAPAAPFFMITIVFEIDARLVGMDHLLFPLAITILWNLPVLVALLMTLRTDLVGKEVNT